MVSATRLQAWDACGAHAWVLESQDDDKRLKIASATCKDRFCVPCADTRSARIGNRIRAKIPPAGISFLTLTLADADLDLSHLIDKLLRSFRQLRAWRRWRETVAGGVAFLEIKWSEKKQRWHPHIHALIEAGYLPQDQISDQWKRITGGSFIVDIRRPHVAESAIHYVTKYGSKALDQSFVSNPDRLDEALQALKGRHLCLAFGAWRAWALIEDDERQEWKTIDSLTSLLDREARGDPQAIKIMEQLRCQYARPIPTLTRERSPPLPSAQVSPQLAIARRSASIAVAALRISLGVPLAASLSVHPVQNATNLDARTLLPVCEHKK